MLGLNFIPPPENKLKTYCFKKIILITYTNWQNQKNINWKTCNPWFNKMTDDIFNRRRICYAHLLTGFFRHSVRHLLISRPSLDDLSKCKNLLKFSPSCLEAMDPLLEVSCGSGVVRESTISSCWHSRL